MVQRLLLLAAAYPLPKGWDQNFQTLHGECAGFQRHQPGRIISASVGTDPKHPVAVAQIQE